MTVDAAVDWEVGDGVAKAGCDGVAALGVELVDGASVGAMGPSVGGTPCAVHPMATRTESQVVAGRAMAGA